MSNNTIILLSVVAIICCLTAFSIIIYTQKYIQTEGEKAGLSLEAVKSSTVWWSVWDLSL